jgi:hypothetical protein
MTMKRLWNAARRGFNRAPLQFTALFFLWGIGAIALVLVFDTDEVLFAIAGSIVSGMGVAWVFLGLELKVDQQVPLPPALDRRVRGVRRTAGWLFWLSVWIVAAFWEFRSAALGLGSGVHAAIWVSLLYFLFAQERREWHRQQGPNE